MDETGWSRTKGAHERLVWARAQMFDKAADGAKHVGMEPGTYRSRERAPTTSRTKKPDHEEFRHFAKRFKVNWRWLLLGEGTPFDPDLDLAGSPIDRVTKAMTAAPPEDQERVATAVELLLKRTGT